mgnify:CR=1 FL=1
MKNSDFSFSKLSFCLDLLYRSLRGYYTSIFHYQHHILLFSIYKVLLLSGKQANYTSLNPYTIRLLWQFLKKKLTEIDEYSTKLIHPRLHISHFVFITSFYYSIRQYHCFNILNSRHLHSNNSSIDL